MRAFLSGHRVLYAAPVIEQINRFWTEVCRALQEPIDAGIYYKNETRHMIELKGTEQAITGKTAWDADSLRGDFGDLLILDEWQLMNEDAWGRVGAPMLLDNNGDAMFIYTPPSIHSRSVTKAEDPRHASKMFKRAEEQMAAAAAAGKESRWLAISWPSDDNPTISETALAEITQDMTALSYRQEIMAEDTTEVPGALWSQALIDGTRVDKAPALVRIVVGIDPSGSSTTEAGIVAAGIDAQGHGYVLRDASLLAPSPERWAAAGIEAYAALRADRIVAERNYGGDMVKSTIHAVDEKVSYHDVVSTRGKMVRAEPICAFYEKGMIHHVGEFPELEDEMCLSAGTLVATLRGDVPIEQIKTGDFALTRRGFRPVLWTGCTGSKNTLTVQTVIGDISCTGSHPLAIIQENLSWKKARDARPGDRILCRGKLSGSASSFGERNTIGQAMAISKRPILAAVGSFIAMSMRLITERFRPPITSIMAIGIDQIMIPQTYSPSLQGSISGFTDQAVLGWSLLPKKAQREKKNGAGERRIRKFALNADDHSRRGATGPSFVPENVGTSVITAITPNGIAEPVYNLHVADSPEFFANGLLVHNCSYVPGAKSPNRMDALVFAMTDLMLESQALGLIDFLKDGGAQKVLDTMNKTARATTLVKPMIPEQAPTCPECGAVTVIRAAGGSLHCNQCGITWADKQTKPTDGHGMTRGEYLMKADERRR